MRIPAMSATRGERWVCMVMVMVRCSLRRSLWVVPQDITAARRESVWSPCLRQDGMDKNFSATRPCGSKGIGGGNDSMKLCVSSSRCESCPAKGEPARAGSQPCDGVRNGLGDAEACERVGHGACGPETDHLPRCP